MFDWLVEYIKDGGYWGIALAMFAENLFPPIPSELIMPAAGYNAARGKQSLLLAALSGTIGSLAGTTMWFYAGLKLTKERVGSFISEKGPWLGMTSGDYRKACAFFKKHEAKSVFFGRMVPAVRSLISLPAGLVEMKKGKFIFFTLLGTFLWTSALAMAGFFMEENYTKLQKWLNGISNFTVSAILAFYFYKLVKLKFLGRKS